LNIFISVLRRANDVLSYQLSAKTNPRIMASEESAITIQFTTVSKLFEEIYSDDARDALVVQSMLLSV